MKKIIIDPGHGGKDPGGGSNLQWKEKDKVLEISLYQYKRFKELGIDVQLTRDKDIYLSPDNRTNIVKNSGADICISNHINSASNINAEGAETIYSIYSNGKLANIILAELCNAGTKRRRAFSKEGSNGKDYYFMHRQTGKVETVIIEYGFASNKNDTDKITKNWKTYAESVIKAVCKYIGTDYKSEEENTEPLSEYYEKYGLKIIETTPENIYVAILPGKTLRQFGIYGINGTWQNNSEAHMPRSIWGLAGNGNKAIGPNSYQNSPKGYKRGTIIYYEDGSIEVKRINNIKEIDKSFKWCIGGGMLIPDYNPTLEKMPNDILRATSHTGMGYKGDRAYLFVHPKCSMYEFRNCVEKLNLDGAIFLDGGGSTQMNYVGGKGIHSSRKLSHGVFLKKA